MGSSFENLVKTVLSKSESKNWEDAVREWELVDTFEDLSSSSMCVCGKENIKYLHKIQNVVNGNVLFPIGSSCINKFNREDLNEKIDVKEKLFGLCHAVQTKSFLSLDKKLFSRKLLKYLYERGAFLSPNYSEKNSYEFILKMFNKRNKDEITDKQKRMITAILLNNIRPFIEKELRNKFIDTKKD